jgi:hypothetical protein
MSFVVGEVDVSPDSAKNIASQVVNPLSNQLQKLATQVGQRYVLLDSVRDATFLGSSPQAQNNSSSYVATKDSLGNTIQDAGLGVVDNGIYFYTTKFKPGSPTVARPYPVKFLWIGSPSGTNDANDNFSIFMADVNQSAYYPGAPASVWLLNPRLVLSWQEAKNDIVNWFNANYPGGGSNGVGSTGSGGNSVYGTLDGDNANPGDVSGMNSIDGQIWPIYDYVDNSIVLYFSIKTKNANTKSIYCYKFTDNEVSSPASSTNFIGGVYQTYWGSSIGEKTTSSHRFSIISPDPLVTTARVSGQQSAVIAYGFGPIDTSSPDHCLWLTFGIIPDIHADPANWNSATIATEQFNSSGVDSGGLYNPDKLGSIFVVPSGQHTVASYALLYNATSDRDARLGSDAVVISGMQVRIAYLHPGTQTVAFGGNISFASGVGTIGHCRPQFTTFPDALPKIVYADFAFDQSLSCVYEYIDMAVLRPENQRNILFQTNGFSNPIVFPTYGKKRVAIRILATNSGYNADNLPHNDPTKSAVVQVSKIDGNWDVSSGLYGQWVYDSGTLLQGDQGPALALNNATNSSTSPTLLECVVEDPSPYMSLVFLTASSAGLPFLEGVIELED